MQAWKAARNALECVLEAVPGERIAIVCDDEKAEIGKAFSEGALDLGLWTRLVSLKVQKEFRKEVPENLVEILSSQKPDLYINLLRGIGEETPFRIKLIHLETRDKKSRLGHCPGVNLDMLTGGALSLAIEEHRNIQSFAQSLIGRLKTAIHVNITSPSGTDLSLSTIGREFYTDTAIDWKKMKWMNLPTGEVIVAPVEDSMNGTLVCDLAIGGIGPLEKTVELSVERGAVKKTSSADSIKLQQVRSRLETDDWSNVVGEFAFGINPKARFVKEFLEAEKLLGSIHIAFGNNTDMPGGRNPSRNHMDLLISKPTVEVTSRDGEESLILKDGDFQIE